MTMTAPSLGPFHFFSEPLSWQDAEMRCSREIPGGHLASIRSSDENQLVNRLCKPSECWIGVCPLLSTPRPHCLTAPPRLRSLADSDAADLVSPPQFNDIATEGTWVWSDGAEASFDDFDDKKAPWNPGEPNGAPNDPANGAYMYPRTNAWVRAGSWDDDDVAKQKPFVCRSPPPPPPPPRPTSAQPFEFFSEQLSWQEAEDHCLSLGGHLASIRSFDEDRVVHRLCDPSECWIGVSPLISIPWRLCLTARDSPALLSHT